MCPVSLGHHSVKINSNKYILVNAVSINSGGGLLILKAFLNEISSENNLLNKYVIFIQEGLLFHNTKQVKFVIVKKKGKFSLLYWHVYGFYRYAKKIIRIENVILVLSLQNFDVYFPGKKRIVYFHQLQILNYQNLLLPIYLKIMYFLYRGIYRISLKTATRIIVQNEWTRNKHFPIFQEYSNKILVIDKFSILKKNDVLQLAYSRANDDIIRLVEYDYLFYPSFFHPHKNHKILFSTVAQLYGDGLLENNFKLVLTISEDLLPKNLPQQIRSFIICLGELSHEQTINLLVESKGLLFPSKAETLGIPLLEAAYLEIPIIVSKEDYSEGLLKGYRKVIYCPSDDISSWSFAVHNVLKNKMILENSYDFGESYGKSLLEILKAELNLCDLKVKQVEFS